MRLPRFYHASLLSRNQETDQANEKNRFWSEGRQEAFCGVCVWGGGSVCIQQSVLSSFIFFLLIFRHFLNYIFTLQPYLTSASWPIASAFPETLDQKARTRDLSMSVRLILGFSGFLITVKDNIITFVDGQIFL